MSKKFTFSRQIVTPEGVETFEACEFDSFDEAKKLVDKAVYERRLEIGPSAPRQNTPLPPLGRDPNVVPVSTSGPVPKQAGIHPVGDNGMHAAGNTTNPGTPSNGATSGNVSNSSQGD